MPTPFFISGHGLAVAEAPLLLNSLAYSTRTFLQTTDGALAIYAPADTGMRWFSDGSGGWIGRGGDIEGQRWLPDGEGGFVGLGPAITGLRWQPDGIGGFIGCNGAISGMHRRPDGHGGFFTEKAANDGKSCLPTAGDADFLGDGTSGFTLRMLCGQGTWGGPVYAYRSAEIWANNDGTAWQLWIDEHPLRGLTLKRLVRAIELADAWIDHRTVPPPRRGNSSQRRLPPVGSGPLPAEN